MNFPELMWWLAGMCGGLMIGTLIGTFPRTHVHSFYDYGELSALPRDDENRQFIVIFCGCGEKYMDEIPK